MDLFVTLWNNVRNILGFDLLALLITGQEKTRAARADLFVYDAKPRSAPDEVIERFYFVTKIVVNLEGSFNDFGIQRWFMRKRVQLNGLSPAQILKGDWHPGDEGPQKVLKLAEETHWGHSAT